MTIDAELDTALPTDMEYRRMMLDLTPHQHIMKAYAHLLLASTEMPELADRLNGVLDDLALLMAATYPAEVTP